MINIHRLTLHLSPLLTLKKCILNQDKVQRDVILPLHSLATKNMDQQVKRPTGTARKPVNWASPLIDTKNKGIATSDIPTLPAHESVQIAAGTSADTWASRGKFSQQPQYRQKTSNEVLEPFTLQCDNRTMHLATIISTSFSQMMNPLKTRLLWSTILIPPQYSPLGTYQWMTMS